MSPRSLICGVFIGLGLLLPACGGGGGSITRTFVARLDLSPAAPIPGAPITLSASRSGSLQTTDWRMLTARFVLTNRLSGAVVSDQTLLAPDSTTTVNLPLGSYTAAVQTLFGPPGATPTAPGSDADTVTSSLNFYVSDCGDLPSLTSSPGALASDSVIELTLPTATNNQPYDQLLPIVGGVAPVTAALAGTVTLPDGLTFTPDGRLSGTPTEITADRTLDLPITLTDSCAALPRQISTLVHLPVSRGAACPALTFNPGSAPAGVIGAPYSWSIEAATGGVGGVDYAISGGTLPAGLTFTGRTISGTPTAAGSSSFTITASDHCSLATQVIDRNVSITVTDTSVAWEEGAGLPAYVGLPPAIAVAALGDRVTVAYIESGDILHVAHALTASPAGASDWQTHPVYDFSDFNPIRPNLGVLAGRLVIAITDPSGGLPNPTLLHATVATPSSSTDWTISDLPEVPYFTGLTVYEGKLAIPCSTLGILDNRLGVMRATLAVPGGSGDWTTSAVISGSAGLAPEPSVVTQDDRLVIGWRESFVDTDLHVHSRPRVSLATSTDPLSASDWRSYQLPGQELVPAIPTGPDQPHAGNVALTVYQGRLAASYAEPGSGAALRQQLVAFAEVDDPVSVDDWSTVLVDSANGGFSDLVVYDSKLLVSYTHTNGGDDGAAFLPTSVARAQTTNPSLSTQWIVEDLALTNYGTAPHLGILADRICLLHSDDVAGTIRFWSRIGAY